jgi:hypothetical protein
MAAASRLDDCTSGRDHEDMTASGDIAPITLTLTPDELRLLVAALGSFASDFGHDEADVLHNAQRLLAKLTSLPAAAAG